MSFITEEVVTDESLANEAADVSAPAPVKKSRSKLTDEDRAAKQAEKEAKAAERAAAKANKPAKVAKTPAAKIDKFVKNLVTAAESGLRAGTGRYQFLEASESAERVSDLVGKEFTVGDKVVKLNAGNIQGMFSRGHIALSIDGEAWDRIQTTVVTE